MNGTDSWSICCFQTSRLDLSQPVVYGGPTVLTESGQEKITVPSALILIKKNRT